MREPDFGGLEGACFVFPTEMSLKSPIIVATKRAITPLILLSQKTSYSLSDLHVGDC